MKAGTETGSLINHLATDGSQPVPVVGMAATVCHWTDRDPATVIRVTQHTVTVQTDKWRRTDGNGMSDCQTYEYARDTNGKIYTFRMKQGRWNCHGLGLSLGGRDRYHDFSF